MSLKRNYGMVMLVVVIGMPRIASAVNIYFVDSLVATSGTGLSWSSPKKTIAEGLAVAASNPPSQVWVKKGVYHPLDADSSFQLRNGVRLYGGFQGNELPESFDPEVHARDFLNNETTLSGEIGGVGPSDNVRVLVTCPAESNSYTIDGFTLEGAVLHAVKIADGQESHGTFRNLVFAKNVTLNVPENLGWGGAGIYVGLGNGPLISKCRFESNKVLSQSGAGGAIALNGSFRARIMDCEFASNKTSSGEGGGAIFANHVGSCIIDRCTFEGNTTTDGFGGAILSDSFEGALIIKNSSFYSNEVISDDPSYAGGAIYFQKFGDVANCYFIKNFVRTDEHDLTGSGGSIQAQLGLRLVNSVLYGNQSAIGGGVYAAQQVAMVNCSVVNNSAVDEGAGLYLAGAGATSSIANNIFWENRRLVPGNPTIDEAAQIRANLSGVPSVRYNDIHGMIVHGVFDNGNNISVKPGFKGLSVGELHLVSTSECRDVGDHQLLLPDFADLNSSHGSAEPTPFDLDNECRREHGHNPCTGPVDLGAYEFRG